MAIDLGHRFAQRVDKTQHYFTHYALFEEPDDGVPDAMYIDAATGQPTQELTLVPPLFTRVWTREQPNPTDICAPTEASRFLPYFVSPPGFPPIPPPQPVVDAICAATGLPAAVVAANTNVLLVALGQFIPDGDTNGRITGALFEVTRSVRFQVRVRTGFLFTPPAAGAPSVGILTGFLTLGLVHQLIGQPPPANPDEIVVYDWRAAMTLSTKNQYVRTFASQPAPVADPFPDDETEISFIGSDVDNHGHYKIVGSAPPSAVTFNAPPELVQFLFHTNQLTDVEFAVSEEGVLSPL